MSAPGAYHDTSEQTPLLAGHSSRGNASASGSGRSKSFPASLLPSWCKTPPGDNAPDDRKGGNGTTFPHRPPNGDHQTGESSAVTNNSRGVPGPGLVHSSAASSSTSGDTTTGPWGDPVGLDRRKPSDENIVLFREAIGIPSRTTLAESHDPESGVVDHPHQRATGIYARILAEKQAKLWQASLLNGLINTCHVAQILVGAVLTTLGPSAQDHNVSITALGATNTVLAGVFALLKGQGLPDRLRKDATAFRRVQDWIEETDALLVAGVVGRDRREVGLLVETAFQKYNAVVASSEEARPPEEATSRAINGATPVPTPGQDLLAVGSGGVGNDGDADEGASTAPRRGEQENAPNGEETDSNSKSVAKASGVQVE
ncbi:hypothetical protein SEUCBS139899_006754 [Sporothrix eucalyptigena]|uniref:SMODS and SLOG-associating 2TM effector domain-containing protein n=1 Tax=Sporothrix eucalyptigena TaxID=1812306 RepID=A0ABP0CJF1_9PEZI